MLIKQVIINYSPLITLFKSQQADLLYRLFTDILIPERVWNEVIAEGHFSYQLSANLRLNTVR